MATHRCGEAKDAIGHKTESIYRRYGIVDQAMLEMGTSKLEALQQAQTVRRPVVVSIEKAEAPLDK